MTINICQGHRDSKLREMLRRTLEVASDADLWECIEAEMWWRCLNLQVNSKSNSHAQQMMLVCREAIAKEKTK